MTVEFRLGRQDHLKVEDFLASTPGGVSAITLDTRAHRTQAAAAEAADQLDIDVLFDPATERLADPGFELPGFRYADAAPYDLDRLVRDGPARAQLVEAVIEGHPSTITAVTPPHFYVSDERGLSLNVALAEETRHFTDLPLRATLVVARAYAHGAARGMAAEYAQAGIAELELRLSPLGGENEGPAKIKSVFAICDTFRAAGIRVTLGQSGNIGRAAVALGHADAYSVGVGMREKTDYSAGLYRQLNPAPPSSDDESSGPRGALAGIYLPGPSLLVSRTVGAALLANTDIRTRIGCRLGTCRENIAGPAHDPRGHYLHARAAEMHGMQDQPSAWRAKGEFDRVRRALELRRLLNRHHLDLLQSPVKTRTLETLLADIDQESRAQTA